MNPHLGFVALLPWNMLITVNGYWDYKFRNVENTENNSSMEMTQDQKDFSSYLAVSAEVPCCVMIICKFIKV